MRRVQKRHESGGAGALDRIVAQIDANQRRMRGGGARNGLCADRSNLRVAGKGGLRFEVEVEDKNTIEMCASVR
jgi:hypothetical protein